eukprot:2159410-Rhodomonas_salina.1
MGKDGFPVQKPRGPMVSPRSSSAHLLSFASTSLTAQPIKQWIEVGSVKWAERSCSLPHFKFGERKSASRNQLSSSSSSSSS